MASPTDFICVVRIGSASGNFSNAQRGTLVHDVVDRRLEAGRGLAGDVVADLVEPVADGELGGDLGDREAGRLGGQGARAADPRVHLDDDHPAGLGIDGELDVRAAGLDADLADDGDRGVAHPLVFLVGQRLGRGDGDAVAGVDAHRVEVLDRADDDDVVGAVAHHLHLVFFPADDRFLDEDLVDRRGVQAVGDQPVELVAVVGDAAAGAAQGEARAAGRRAARSSRPPAGLRPGCGPARPRQTSRPICSMASLEQVAVLGLGDRVGVGADHLDAVLLQHAVPGQGHGHVQAGLAAERGQQGVGLLGLDDLGDDSQVIGSM